MKHFILFIIPLITLACNQPKLDDLASKKAALAEKSILLKQLQQEIDQLSAEIETLEPTKEKKSVIVDVDTLKKIEFNRYIDVQGIVAPVDEANAMSELGGRLLRVYVKEGQFIKKGQLVATTDAESFEKQKEELQKSLDLAVDLHEKQKRLWEQKIGSEVQYLQAKNSMERLEQSLKTLEVQIRKKNIYAPLSGVVDFVFLKDGEIAGPGVPIIKILNTNKLKIVSDIPENYIGKIKKGDKVNVSMPALGVDIALPVTMIGRTIDPSNRTFKMEAIITSAIPDLKPNLLSIIKINDYTKKDVIVIAADHIQQEVSGRQYVYTVEQKDQNLYAKKTYIETGESANNNIIVQSGLGANDLLITKGARNIVDNQRIIIE